MCGIFGYFGEEPQADALMQRMAKQLHHRGPDGMGYHCDTTTIPAGLGNTRLAIIDVEHGQQPFRSEDGTITVVQNGEIFNYKELMGELEQLGHRFNTQCDTEVILRAYEQWGAAFISRLNGMFAIAVFDAKTGTLHLYRDRVGIKPFYYYHDGNRFLFASEIKALLAADIPRKINLEALHHFLSFNYTPQPFTFFKNVKQVPSGHQLTISERGITSQPWWKATDIHCAEPASEASAEEQLRELLSEATRIRLRSDVEVGAFLSGGVDSSSVVAYATQHLREQEAPHRLRTFSIGFDDARYDESAFALEAAERFGTNHTNRIVEQDMLALWPLAVFHCDQPHGDVSFMPTYCVSQLAAEQLKVVLTGDGGDELFAGYDKYKNFAPRAQGQGWQRDYFESISLLRHEEKTPLYADSMAPFAAQESFDLAAPLFHDAAHLDGLNQMLAFDMHYLLSGNNLPKPDRMGMATSIEARTPFLDYRMMEYALSLPGHYKLRDGETKYILKKAMSKQIGNNLAYRKKQMFTVPIGDWFAGEKGAFMQSILTSNRFTSRGLFQPSQVRHMIDSHRAGTENHTRILRALIAIELWLRIFIDRDELSAPSFSALDIMEEAA